MCSSDLYHADTLAESLTSDLVRVIASMLGATEDEARGLQFQFAPERPNVKERIEAVEKFVALGGRVSEREVRDLLGLAQPADGEAVLGGAKPDANPLTALLGQGGENEGEEPEPEAPKVVAVRKTRASRKRKA